MISLFWAMPKKVNCFIFRLFWARRKKWEFTVVVLVCIKFKYNHKKKSQKESFCYRKKKRRRSTLVVFIWFHDTKIYRILEKKRSFTSYYKIFFVSRIAHMS